MFLLQSANRADHEGDEGSLEGKGLLICALASRCERAARGPIWPTRAPVMDIVLPPRLGSNNAPLRRLPRAETTNKSRTIINHLSLSPPSASRSLARWRLDISSRHHLSAAAFCVLNLPVRRLLVGNSYTPNPPLQDVNQFFPPPHEGLCFLSQSCICGVRISAIITVLMLVVPCSTTLIFWKTRSSRSVLPPA